jgi:hypothetical protein
MSFPAALAIARFLRAKYRGRDVQTSARALRKQGFPIEIALLVLL